MLILLPVAHTQTIRRLPWVTISIMAVCLAVQVQSSFARIDEVALDEAWAEKLALERADAPNPPKFAAAYAQLTHEERQAKIAECWNEMYRLMNADLSFRLAYRNGSRSFIHLFTSAFAHGGWMHLLGNMLFLYLCGCNLEDRWGRLPFLGFYLGAAFVSSLTCALTSSGPGYQLGASGAIAGCMGAFLAFYGTTEITFAYAWLNMYRPRWGTFQAAAYWALPLWLLQQLIGFFFELHRVGGGGTAYSAHVGGFVFGLGFALVMKRLGYDAVLRQAVVEPGAEWTEDPTIAEALLAAHEGRDDALPGLIALHAANPRHAALTDAIFSAGLRLQDRPALERSASGALLEEARNGDAHRAIARWLALESLKLEVHVDGRTLSALGKAALELKDFGAAVQLTNTLLRTEPKSPLLPGLLLEMSKTQLEAGRADLARRTLEQIVARWPLDPFAREAQRMLDLAPLWNAAARGA